MLPTPQGAGALFSTRDGNTVQRMSQCSWRPRIVSSFDHYCRAIAAFLKKNQDASSLFVQDKPRREDWFRKHLFRPAANICIDERVQDLDEAMGLLIGILEAYRAGGSKSSLSSLPYARRCYDGIARLAPIRCDGSGKPDARGCSNHINRTDVAPCEGANMSMVEMRMVTAHYSNAYPDSHSCAAWDHQTDEAVKAMISRAEDLNLSFCGRMVAFPVLIDTDLDAITVVGPYGRRLSVRSIVEQATDAASSDRLMEDLHMVFPSDWEPLTSLEPPFREAFHRELLERIEENIRYVRHAIGRPPELLDHKGELVFVGRHADWIREHNSVFLIDDTEDRTDVLSYFALALQYVARNVILRAIREHDDDWLVPVVINIPYDGEQDERVTQVYAHKLREALEQHAQSIIDSSIAWILHGPKAIPSKDIPDKMFRQIYGLKERIVFMTSVSRRADRLFHPFM